jgi:hypothetical protein
MTKADSVLSTPPTNTSALTPRSSRRGFLVQAAVLTAGGAALGASLPLPALPAATAAGPDPIFAAIEAHRSAEKELAKAVTAADIVPDSSAPAPRILLGFKDGKKSTWIETEGGGLNIIVTPTGQKEPVYASYSRDILANVPKELQGAERSAWISDREAELEAAEERAAQDRAHTEIGKLEAALDEAETVERDRMWDLVWAMPTTLGGLAALFQYCREQESINELVHWDEWEDVLEWTMECAVCTFAGLPKPPMSELVACVRNEYALEMGGPVHV